MVRGENEMGTPTLLESRQGCRRETFPEENSSVKMHSNGAGCEQWGPTFVEKGNAILAIAVNQGHLEDQSIQARCIH